MPLAQRLAELVQACFTGIWIESHEHDDALLEMAALCREHEWQLMTWDVEQGLKLPGTSQAVDGSATDPLAAIRSLAAIENQGDSSCLLVLRNFHRFLQSAEIVQALQRQLSSGKQNRTFVVILSPVVQIPVELEKQIVIIEHDLPDREQLGTIARGIATDAGELARGAELQRLLDAAAGLTRYEAENAFSLSLVRHGKLQVETLWELKSQMLKKSGLMQLYRGGDTFRELGGLDSLKSFCKRALRTQPTSDVHPRGVLLLSPPGCGKSAFCKCLGNETGRPTLVLDIGSLLGSLVGQTEQNIRQALKIADVMAPAVIFLDECEKALSGAAGQGDSGVSARLFGTFLSWLNDRESDTFVVATANDISRLPPEFSRSERFDAVFFVDLPGPHQRQAIWQLYLGKYRLDASQKLPADDDWTGAEIKSCCRLSALLDVPLVAAAQNIVPVAKTSAEAVEKLRTWASGRCLSADAPGIYQRQAAASPRRRVSRDPSSN
jgi:hypothetical protein